MIYKAKNFKRNYECTSIKFIETSAPVDPAYWEPSSYEEIEKSGATMLSTEWQNNQKTNKFGWI